MLKKITVVFCVIVLTLNTGTTAFAGTTNTSIIENRVVQSSKHTAIPSELKEIQSKLQPYISTSDDGHVTFDEGAAIEDGIDEEIIDIGRQLNQFSRAMQANPDNASQNARASFPVWGNWCGPGHSGPAAPVDVLDAQCKKHDLCYADRGYFACSCDRALEYNIVSNWGKMGAGEKAMAAAIFTFFANFPCNPFA